MQKNINANFVKWNTSKQDLNVMAYTKLCAYETITINPLRRAGQAAGRFILKIMASLRLKDQPSILLQP